MSEYNATIRWSGEGDDFAKGRYSRTHDWHLGGGATCRASASPHIVPPPYSQADAIDPEEALVASISSCHMLWFLDLARQAGFIVETYEDAATGTMSQMPEGGLWVSKVDLHPKTQWRGATPDRQTMATLHEDAHQNCFIANSVKTDIETHL